jgi:broad specificity phosphatase PhoE
MQSQRRVFTTISGRSTRGANDRFCGFTDPPLSVEGSQAVLSFRQGLQSENHQLPHIWYVSDRRRAIETFEIITAGMRAPVLKLCKNLRELHFGDYENLTWEELPPDFQQHYESNLATPMNLTFPGGESFREMADRVSRGAIEILTYDLDDSDIGVVGHQGSIRLWEMMAEELPPESFFDVTPAQADGRYLTITVSHVSKWRRQYLELD